MLKKRLIPKFLLRDGRLVKYVRFFENERIAGNPVTTAKVYNDYGVDELIVLDIVPSEASRSRVVDIIERMSEEIFMPFTVNLSGPQFTNSGSFTDDSIKLDSPTNSATNWLAGRSKISSGVPICSIRP